MPYPVGHLVFFMFCVLLAGMLAMAAMSFKVRMRLSDARHLKLYMGILVLAGCTGSLFPDVPALWNFILHGNLRHVTVGPVPTHSLFFGIVFFCIALMIGYLIYGKRTKAVSVGLFAGAGFISHLMLDDLAEGSIYYLYPFYGEPFRLFYSFFV
ncbi:metal-dependent hydrolase [Methanomethylovorans sp.]|uniref:metal-dependent hydrolase n=1 Tax=Methanomethylovorans sp. TaxID=2758717 RepID=UPI00351C5BF5